MKALVESLVLSIVKHWISIYGSFGTTQERRIQKIVHLCARVVTGRRLNDCWSESSFTKYFFREKCVVGCFTFGYKCIILLVLSGILRAKNFREKCQKYVYDTNI